MTDRSIGSTAEGDSDPADDPTDDRAQHASADVAPELFGW
jgi:hypothetical protein